MKAIIGLGNPGRAYSGTRHNVGFEVVEKLGKKAGIHLRSRHHQALYGVGEIEGEPVVLVKPLTFMNNSGIAVRQVMRRWDLKPEEILIVADDMNLPLGKLRIRMKGSAGGHNGLKSIIAHLSSEEFPRLRVGVGHPQNDAVDHVLSRFQRSERTPIHQAEDRAADAVRTILREGILRAMDQFNRDSA